MIIMTNEQIIKFLSDPKVIAELKKLKSEEEIINYIKENGIEITFKKAQIIKEALTTIDSYSGKLTDEQLEDIVGGASVGKIVAGIILGAAAVATIAGGGKFSYDVYNKIEKKKTFGGGAAGFAKGVATDLGVMTETPYQQAVSAAAEWVRNA